VPVAMRVRVAMMAVRVVGHGVADSGSALAFPKRLQPARELGARHGAEPVI
jgi:hypothetical protein